MASNMERFFEKTTSVRMKEFFGFDWKFALTDSREFPGEGEAWRGVQLPHDWSVDYEVEEDASSCGSGGYARTGIGWYRRSFEVCREEQNLVSLYFEGVYMNCDVWVNGVHVGGHVYGYTSFEVDVTEALREGENEILVRVDNSHQPGSRWYTGSGITRDVYLVCHKKSYIKTWGVGVTTPMIAEDKCVINIGTDMLGLLDQSDITIETEILDHHGNVRAKVINEVLAKDEITALQEVVIENPEIWDIDHPVLYGAISRLRISGALMDEVRTPFGIRDIAFNSEQGFLLNGRKVILKGVCLHHDGGCVGAAVPPEVWRRRLEKLKTMGANALRCSHNPPTSCLLDLADEMGFVVMDEAFDEWQAMKGKEFGSNTHESRGYSEWFNTCWQQDMASMVLRDRNHPSIIMWSIGNEVREQVIAGGKEIARKLAGLCHSMDPTRPITQACDQVKAEPVPAYDDFLEELDIVGVNYTDRWRERTETFFEEEKREHPDWLLMGTEDIAVNGRRGDCRLQTEESVWGPTPYYSHMLKVEKLWKFIRTRPYVIGSFMWTGIDYLGECFWPDKGSAAGVIDTCGFEKDGYYFYQSIWTKEQPVVYVHPHLNLNLELGTIYPLVVYTNCFSVELFVDGRSYGVKAYEFPAQGMTKHWAHFDRAIAPITTNDLHLTWDIPYTQGEIMVVGRDCNGQEVIHKIITKTGNPTHMEVTTDHEQITANGRDVVQFEISLKDAEGRVVLDQDIPIIMEVENGTLLGMDNGKPDCHTPYQSGTRETFGGLAYAIIRAPRSKGIMKVKITAENLPTVERSIEIM